MLTIGYHVPRNNALASAGAGGAWREYAPGWTAWNHVRTVTSLGGAACFAAALSVG